MLGGWFAAVESGEVPAVGVDEVGLEDGGETMVLGDGDVLQFDHLAKEEEKHPFADCTGPDDACGLGSAGEEAVEVVGLGVACYPADLDEALAEHLQVSDGDVSQTESDVGDVGLDGWLGFTGFWGALLGLVRSAEFCYFLLHLQEDCVTLFAARGAWEDGEDGGLFFF